MNGNLKAWRTGVAGVCTFFAVAIFGSASSIAVAGAPTTAYTVTNLTSDGAVPADSVDPDLKNPWGIAFDPLGPAWFSDNGSNLSTLYVAFGLKFPITVSIPAGKNGPAGPTGIVYNPSLTEFMINQAGAIGSAQFIFAGESGTISAWSQLTVGNVDMGAETMYDDGPGGAVYKGLALAANGSADFLYATDFHNAKIDVFNNGFKKVTSPGGFKDPALPAGYAPFGIQAIGGQLYVTYALQRGPSNDDQVNGPGLGLIDLFDTNGDFIRRVATGGPLNAPWGMALAPAGFGEFSHDLLVGNFGDGAINAFVPSSGQFIDRLRGAGGTPISIPGLWGITFGNSLLSNSSWLYFGAGIDNETHGLYGQISPPTLLGL